MGLIELPAEIIVEIYQNLNDWEDVLANQHVCKFIKNVLCENASKLARPPIKMFIENKTGGISFNNSSCNSSFNIDGLSISLRKYNNSNFLQINFPFNRLQISSLNINGPLTENQLYLIADHLKIGKQQKIKSICLENIYFETSPATNYLFSQLFQQQKFQKIKIKNCFYSNKILNKFFDDFSQLKINLDKFNFKNNKFIEFSVKTLQKFAVDLRYKMKRNLQPFVWEGVLPLNLQLYNTFVETLCLFIENWLYNNETTPNFHIKIKNCSDQFALDFTNCCAQRRLLYASDFRFYSKTQHLAYIQGKFNFEKHVFELFPERSLQQLYQVTVCRTFPSAISFARFYRDVF
uniref:Uncharacterized protein n=1 Tax=Meloidogyne enterolobii TaxID=390850 RepID=A0A6V7UFF2_MELEN|nr:unnamed protein product [Meloidogyne enterolobii]